jgi:hypothetical protein
MALVKAKVSSVVSRQVPEFIREDNTQFIAFLEAYYEFLEQTEKRNLESTRDIDDTIDSFIQYFRNEVLLHVPLSTLSDKRYLAKQIHEVYRSKGTTKSYEFLFRILFNETPELYFPQVVMLRLSDGKWDQAVIIRCIETSGNSFNLIGQTINQGISRASVESVIKFQIGADTIAELTLNEQSLVGTFNTTDSITGLDNTNNSVITLDILSVITDFEINNNGSYYRVGDPIDLISGTGTDAQIEVTNIGYGSIDDIIIDNPGSGYSIGTELTFDNTDAGDLAASLVTAKAIITDIDVDSILMEDGSKLLSEQRDHFDLENVTTGGIKAISLLTGGYYYKKLPIVSATGGTGAKLIAIGDGIGRVTKVGITNPGVRYETAPIAVFPYNIVVKDITGAFTVGDAITVLPQTLSLETDVDSELLLESGDKMVLESQQSPNGTIFSYDTSRNLITLYPTSDRIVIKLESENGYLVSEDGKPFVDETSGQFETNQTITNSSGATAKIISGSGNHAEATGIIGAVGRTLGKFINADGKVSESSKKIQDSLFYQEYSYVIKVGQSIDKYRDAVKKLLHPIGLALFGEVTVQSLVQSPSSITLEVSELLQTIRLFLDMKMRAVGNYRRSGYEDNSALDKEQVTIIITDFLSSHLSVLSVPSEFLPVLHLPELTPTEVHLLDLRAEVGESYKVIYHSTFNEAVPTYTSSFANLELRSMPTAGSLQFGPNLAWLERWKFTIPPYAAGTKESIGVYRNAWSQDYDAPNQGYWDTYANTQIKDFANIIILDVINNPNRRTNFAKEAYITIIKQDGIYTFDGSETVDDDFITMDELDVRSDSSTSTMDTARITFDTV